MLARGTVSYGLRSTRYTRVYDLRCIEVMPNLHDIHDFMELLLLLNVQLLHERLKELPSLIVWHVGIRRARTLNKAFHIELSGTRRSMLGQHNAQLYTL
jgi:hypothetical protein